MIFDLDDVAAAVGGRVIGDSVRVEGAGIDSRRMTTGALFVALVSDRDGHDFVSDASAAGAGAAMVQRPLDVPLAQVVVADTAVALEALGRAARRRLEGSVIGITGSVGKTTTKDLLASICGLAGSVGASERSLNNELGVPLTLIGAPDGADRVVVEMGARGPGHIAHLCDVAAPTVGVVTVVAAAHTEMFGGLDEIALAKGELIEALPGDGLAVLNADDALVSAMAGRSAAPVLGFGRAGEVRAERIEVGPDLRARFTLCSPWGDTDVSLGVSGRHNVTNALAAAAAALGTGVDLGSVSEGLATAALSPWRMELRVATAGGAVINDAYNANPTSLRAALDALAHLDAERRVAVLGRMAELGPTEADDHRAIADHARSRGIEVVGVGTDLYGLPWFADVDDAAAHLDQPGEGTAVLIKGSRVAGLERLAALWCRADQV